MGQPLSGKLGSSAFEGNSASFKDTRFPRLVRAKMRQGIEAGTKPGAENARLRGL
jgi:hypothetical protein